MILLNKFVKSKKRIYTSGLSAEFDNINGGFATQELVMLGDKRGSGKSIISLNLASTDFCRVTLLHSLQLKCVIRSL